MSVMTSRRTVLRGLAAAGFAVVAPGLALAASDTAMRFVFIIQRGAADGLDTVIPYADPAYASLRRGLAIPVEKAIRLNGQFALHPSLAELHRMYQAGDALLVHAVATTYRDRSHFDAQNVLESGGGTPHQLRDGWMNRLLGLLPAAGRKAVAVAPTIPLALRGPIDVDTHAPSALPAASDDLLMRVQQLYEDDRQLRPLWEAAMQTRTTMGDGAERRRDAATVGQLAARLLARPDGPRLAMIETSGWDTHSGQAIRLASRLRDVDTLLAALRDGLGTAWGKTVVVVATEFGRTVAANGTGGTDHGTAGVALVAGGAVRGGAIRTDWPGLAPSALHEGRDLRPTLGLEPLLAGLVSETFSLDPARTTRTLFPSLAAKPLQGLVKSVAT